MWAISRRIIIGMFSIIRLLKVGLGIVSVGLISVSGGFGRHL